MIRNFVCRRKKVVGTERKIDSKVIDLPVDFWTYPDSIARAQHPMTSERRAGGGGGSRMTRRLERLSLYRTRGRQGDEGPRG